MPCENTYLSCARENEAQIIEYRHALHRIPELAYNEFETAAFIRAELARLGIPCREVGTGTIADIPGGSGPMLALRADIDALPISEPAGCAFGSIHPGRMHACGHDCNAAMLLGTARILWEHKDRLPGAVRLIFQPAEEGGAGARAMIDAGCLEGVRSIYCLHMGANRAVGHFATKPEYIHASSDGYTIDIHGKSAHGASPDNGIDAMVIAAHTILALQELISRETSPHDSAVLTLGKISGGEVRNIICEKVTIDGTLRTLDESVRKRLIRRICEVAADTARVFRGSAEVNFVQSYATCWNEPNEAGKIIELTKELFGSEALEILTHTGMGGEDFGFYQLKVPGIKLYLGTGCKESVHTPGFRIDESTLKYGTALLCGIAFERYKSK